MQFYNRELIWMFWLLPVLLLVFWGALRRKHAALRKFGTFETVLKMSSFSSRDWWVKAAFIFLAVAFAQFALLRPQWGAEKKKIQRRGVDVMFLLDTSLSMLAQDTKPSRIEKARIEIKSFVKKLRGDRVGLVPFAGSSFLQAPLTLDYSAFFLFLDAVSVGYIPDPGSSLREALESAISSFPKEEKKYRVVVVLSDGEFFGEDLSGVLKKATQEGVKIYTIGFGTREGEPIPLKAEKGKVVGYKKDKAGQVVLSKLNDELMTSIATQTGGLYYPATPAEQEIDLVLQDMRKIGKRKFKDQMLTEREDHYQFFLLLGLAFLILEALWAERARTRGKEQDDTKDKAA